MRTYIRAFSILAVALLLQIASQGQTTLLTRPEALQQDPRSALISAGDLIQISVFDEPQLSSTARVAADGTISLPLAGDLQVSGMTPEQAATHVEGLLLSRRILLRPKVVVLVSQYATAGVSVEGEVKTPGSYTLLGNHTLLDALSAAGGLKPSAGSKVIIKRRGGDGNLMTVSLNLEDAEATTRSDVPVFPNDLIVVPRAGVVYVLGDVTKPGAFTMRSDGRLTLMQAIAQAQGTGRTAALSSVRILHRRSDGSTATSVLRLKKIEEGKQEDIELSANDIVYVPSSAFKASAATLANLSGAVATAVIYTSR